ncbi:MAG TPA: tetratricopeptide repeat protein [Patescibacteria group bacterium]|nr:tetratricopeptide repeat protein [Patescibacteria group bacterium]
MYCPACGRENPPGAARCGGCARPLSGAGPPPEAPPEEATRITGASGATGAPGATGVTGILGPARGAAPGGSAPWQTITPGTPLGTRYLIESILGEGGMGMVYRARDLELDRTVALKVIRPELASRPEILDRFKREIQLASRVTHKNVVRIHDLGEVGDLRFISMSFIEGESLRALLDREGPLAAERGVPLVRQIAVALQAAHDAGIVHRDLKPHNVLIDKEGQPYIGDFGISRSMDSDGTMTETGAILGTVDYMSPEQARGDVPDHRSDIYSLGMMMYEMFTGTLPFRAANPLSVMVKRVHEDAPPVTAVRPGIPPWLSAVIGRAMQRDPNDRYQSLGDLVRDLDRQQATRAARRLLWKRTGAAAAVLAGVLAVGYGATWWIGSRPRTAPAVKTSLAVLPFQNQTGDPRFDWVRSGVTSVVRTGLLQAQALRLAGDDRVQEILDLLKPAPGEESRPTTVQRVGRLAGVDQVLVGSLVRIGSGYRIDASLMPIGESGAGAARPIVLDGANEAAILKMIDDLTRRVREELGVTRGWGEKEIGAAQLSTSSVEALSLYGEGLALGRSGNAIEAAKRLEAAVAKDPRFAMAQAELAETYDALGYADKAKKAADEAVQNLRGASPWEAAHIRATRARLAGDLQGAETALRSIVAAAPNDPQSILDLAQVEEGMGDLPAALASLQRVVVLDPKHADATYALGRVLFKSGHPTDAIVAFNRALALDGDLGNDQGRAAALNGLGNASQGLNQLDDAERYFNQSLEIRRRIGDQRGVAVCLHNLSLVERTRGRYDEAIRYGKEALQVSTGMGDQARIAENWMGLGDAYQDAGRPEQALAAYQESLKIMRGLGDDSRLAENLRSLGYVNGVLGNYVEAFFFMKEGLAKTRSGGDKNLLVRALADIATIEQLQGRYEEALTYNAEGLALAKEVDDQTAQEAIQRNLADIHQDQGDYGAALALFDETARLIRTHSAEGILADCLTSEGGAHLRAGNLEMAGKLLGEAIALSRKLHKNPTLAEALLYEARRMAASRQPDKAATTLREAVQVAGQVGDFRLIRMARLAQATADRSSRDLETVLADVTKAGLSPLVSPALLELARLDLATGRPGDAAQRAQKAAAAAGPLQQRDLLFQARHLAGAALDKQGQRPAALEQYRQALQPLEEMRSGLVNDALKAFLSRPETAAFGRDADAAFRAAGGDERARLEKLLTP